MEENGTLPFLDVLVTRKDLTFGHTMYRKPTHTGRYLHKTSNHHPLQKNSLINSLIFRALRVCDEPSLAAERRIITDSLLANGYQLQQINKCWERQVKKKNYIPKQGENNEKEKEADNEKRWISLPFLQGTMDKIAKLMRKYGIRTLFAPTTKIEQILRNPKDQGPMLINPGVYEIKCGCGRAYIGNTMKPIKVRVQEHQRAVKLSQGEKSAVAAHALESGHQIAFDQVRSLFSEASLKRRLNLEAISISQRKPASLLNRQQELSFANKIWLPILKRAYLQPKRNRAEVDDSVVN